MKKQITREYTEAIPMQSDYLNLAHDILELKEAELELKRRIAQMNHNLIMTLMHDGRDDLVSINWQRIRRELGMGRKG